MAASVEPPRITIVLQCDALPRSDASLPLYRLSLTFAVPFQDATNQRTKHIEVRDHTTALAIARQTLEGWRGEPIFSAVMISPDARFWTLRQTIQPSDYLTYREGDRVAA